MAVKSIQQIEAYWDSFSDKYVTQDNGTNVFYLSLLNMLRVEKRNAILEVGAGAGFLYHHTLNRKHPNAKYTATDLSEKMLGIMCQRLKIQGDLTKGIFDEKHNLVIEKANGEQLPFNNESFDCYIANLCLQITTDPVKMIAESHRVLQKGGVAGFTVWGEKSKSDFFTIIPKVLSEYGIQPPEVRSNFHLNDREKLIKMMEDQGFTNVICWNQYSPFHHTTESDILDFLNFTTNATTLDLAGDKREEVVAKVVAKFKEHLYTNKYPVGLDGLLIIGTKN